MTDCKTVRVLQHRTASSTFRDFQKATPRSSGLFRHLWPKRPLRRSEISKSQTAFFRLVSPRFETKNDLIVRGFESNRVRLISPRFRDQKRPHRCSEIFRPTAFFRLISPRFETKTDLIDLPRFLAQPRSSGLFRGVFVPQKRFSPHETFQQ